MSDILNAETIRLVTRAVEALSGPGTPESQLGEVLGIALALVEAEGGLISVSPESCARLAGFIRLGETGKIPPACCSRAMRSGRSIAPAAADGTTFADDPPEDLGPVIAMPLRSGDRVHGALALRLNGGPALSRTVWAALCLVANCAVAILVRNTPEQAAASPSGRIAGEGVGSAFERMRTVIEKAAPSRAGVLIVAESGCGKELLAREIHARSGRKGPFLAVNVSAIPDTLLEAEMNGWVKGGHSQALKDRAGHFEAAHGGTLLLDEIGDATPAFQASILRVIEEREIVRLGDTRRRKIDVRIIAATNKDLRQLVREEKFREDLYYRIAVVKLELPPLRERPQDIAPIAEALLDEAARDLDLARRRRPILSAGALRRLQRFPWPGNVRQLRNVLHFLVLFCETEIGEADVESALRAEESENKSLPAAPASAPDAQSDAVEKAIAANNGRVAATARSLGISRQALWKKRKRPSRLDEGRGGGGATTGPARPVIL